ncbi:hypothetical protein BGZ76_007494, partial [Entomortierella beljakovae]
GEITILSGNEDLIHIHTSVQARESILKNAAALDPAQDGNRYTYTIHTPLEDKLEKAVTFQVFITIPKILDSLESFHIEGANVEVSIGKISHTFIKHLHITNAKGDISIDNFFGEYASIESSHTGSIRGRFNVARLNATTKAGRIVSKVHLLNTDDQQPPPKVICQALHHTIGLRVDGTDLVGPFSVEAKTQCAPLDVKLLLSSEDQNFLGNFINFGGPTRLQMTDNYQGRIETRTHYGKIFIDEPKFVKLKDATLTVPSQSDRNYQSFLTESMMLASVGISPQSGYFLNGVSSKSASQGTSMSWGDDHHPHHLHKKGQSSSSYQNQPSSPDSINGSGPNSRPESMTGSFGDLPSSPTSPTSPSLPLPFGPKPNKSIFTDINNASDKDYIITRELIGTVGDGPGLVIVKNSSENIHVKLI